MSPVAFRPHSCRQLTFDEAWEFGPICQGIWRRESWFEDMVEGSSDEEEVNEGVVVIDWDRENRRSRIVAAAIVRAARNNAIWRPLGFEYSLDQESCSVPSCISDGNTKRCYTQNAKGGAGQIRQ